MTVDWDDTTNDRIALFTCADAIGQNQFNAWESWKTIPNCSVCVFGGAPGLSDHAERFGFRSIPAVKRDEFGRPLLSWIFECIHKESTESVLGYVNSDIIILPGLAESIAAVRAQFDAYLIVARRWNIESIPAMKFESGWDDKLRQFVTEEGELFTPYGMDLFIFSRGLLRDIPPFALGSDYWDNYLVMQTRRKGYPVIDVTQQVMLVHQNHSLGKYRSVDERRCGPEGLRAFALVRDSYAMLGRTTDATHFVANGKVRQTETAHVTVVLPHRGESRGLCRCIRAIEHQTYPQSFLNTIVVNNDPDAPLRYLEADFPSVRVMTEAHPGTAAALNKGISCSNADVVAIFESDIVPAADYLERAMRVMKGQPDCQFVVCRIDPLLHSGKISYIGRTVEWFDAVTHYNPENWVTYAGAFVTGALIVKKEVFAKYGYFSSLCPEIATEEWAKRMIASGVKMTFCREAFVRQETVKSIASLRRKMQWHARGNCILKSVNGSEAYRVSDVLRDEWIAFRSRVMYVWNNKRIPPRYLAGVLFLAVWSCIWTLRAKLQYRTEAKRVVSRRRQAMNRSGRASDRVGLGYAYLPFRWLTHRSASRRIPNQDALHRFPRNGRHRDANRHYD